MQGLAVWAPETLASHRPFLYSYALSRLRQPSTAEELVQETLLAAVEGQAPFKGESRLRTWLMGILKHKIIDWHRSEARNPARPTARSPADTDDEHEDTCDALFDSAGNWVNPPSAWPNPEQSLENQRFWEMMESCLASLPAATGRAFYLREIQGLSTEEICAELGISQSNCWVMLHRARLGLRQSLEERWFVKDEVRAVSSRPVPTGAIGCPR
ncbi:MAG: sigma-70 family RNA polymerase sigma factor [Betaproteobacteria bacterium]|nr:MAG: sigma-70 family RNA polymerase sigma factor [Betaproteobacteria bacterium]